MGKLLVVSGLSGVGKDTVIEELIKKQASFKRLVTCTDRSRRPGEVLPIVEQKFDLLPEGKYKIASFELKWIYEYKMKSVSDVYECPAKLDDKTRELIEKTSKEIYKLLDVKGCARMDYRLDKNGNLYFLEINTLPGINPDPKETSCYPLAARTAGLSYKELVGKILSLGCERFGLK